jgi:uncharacterized protein
VSGNYVQRMADSVLEEMVREHPAVLVVGPRATGKTTSCERVCDTSIHLGNPAVAGVMRVDPTSVLSGLPEPILIDEWQEAPESLQAIKQLVDSVPTRGRFVVTGSVRGEIDAPTWPGTGRLVRLAMYGLTEREVDGRLNSGGNGGSWLTRVLNGTIPPNHHSQVDLRNYVARALRSGFPEPALRLSDNGRRRWLNSYVEQLVTRDAESISRRRDPQRLRAYLNALALNSAGVVDDSTLWSAAGIAKDTARAYDGLLQNLLISERLPAWTSNRLKRLTLAPKRYLVDSGLIGGVLGVTEHDVLQDVDLLGRLLETFVVAQVRAEVALMASPPRMHHLRTAEGRQEIDLIIEVGPKSLVAIEIKATSSPDSGDTRHLRWLRRELGSAVRSTLLLHTGAHTVTFDDGTVATPISSLWEA